MVSIKAFAIIFAAIVLLAMAVTFFPAYASAAPGVASFSSNLSSVNFSDIVTFSWSLSDSGSATFKIPCKTGFKFFYANGTAFACGAPVVFNASSGTVDIKAYNLSNGPAAYSAVVTPRDVNLAEYPAGAGTAYVTVATLPQTIVEFTYAPPLLSWSAPYLDGVNLQIPCVDGVRASSPTYTAAAYLPCGTPVFATDLSPSGSMSVTLTNESSNEVNYTMTLLPAMAPGIYDGAHTRTVSAVLPSAAAASPSVTSFSASAYAVLSGSTVLSWDVANAAGVNLKIACAYGISATSTTSASELPCGVNAFSEPLPAKGGTTLYFKNSYSSAQQVKISLLPSAKAGEYNAVLAKDIYVTVYPTGYVVPPPTPTPSTILTPINTNYVPTPTPKPTATATASPTAKPKPSVSTPKYSPSATPTGLPKSTPMPTLNREIPDKPILTVSPRATGTIDEKLTEEPKGFVAWFVQTVSGISAGILYWLKNIK